MLVGSVDLLGIRKNKKEGGGGGVCDGERQLRHTEGPQMQPPESDRPLGSVPVFWSCFPRLVAMAAVTAL